MTPDLFWIPGRWSGKLAVSTRPRGEEWLEDEVAGWRRAGLDVIASFLEEEEAAQLGLNAEREIVESSGLRFLSLPIPDRGVPSSMVHTVELLNEMTSALAAGKNVALHCRQGVGRSGMMAAAALVAVGVSPSAAVKTVTSARGVNVPETLRQMEWLRLFAEQRLAMTP